MAITATPTVDGESLRWAVLGRPMQGEEAMEKPDGRRDERRLIRDAQGGSEEAIERLFRSHWPRAHRAAYLVVRDAAAAEDIAQESFLAALRALDRFDRRRPFGPWLHRIVVNRAIDWSRARTLRGEVSQAAELTDSSQPEGMDRGRYSADLEAALWELSVEHRAVVVLRFLLDYTPGEIARMLGVPRGTVNSRLRRALDRLAESIAERES
jgi:RNA polymerase sigma-70 factor (ECF subfamily)